MPRLQPSWRPLAVVLVLATLPTAWGLAQSSQSAFIRVLLPPGAENATLMFDAHATKEQTGSDRLFVTPALTAGKKFTYDVSATWTQNGKDIKLTRKVDVAGGQMTVVDFTKAEPGAKKGEPKKDDAKNSDPKKDGPEHGQPKTRTFKFVYGATGGNLPAGKVAKVWIPVAGDTPEQKVVIEKQDLPGKAVLGVDPQYGNKILFFEAMPDKDGNVNFAVTYHVTRREVHTDGSHFRKPGEKEKIDRYLQADKLVPLEGKPLELVKDKKVDPDQLKAGKLFYDIVNNHMKYSKEGKGWGRGDVEWACDSKFGNCSDFHSVFIALARAHKIPAKFEIGFPIPSKRGEGPIGGYHCWAWFLPDGKGWVPVDISEANRFPELRDYYFGNLSEDRVQLATGRDIDLVPRQAGPPLNLFIYPYVEVDGQPIPPEQIKGKYSYQDVK